MGAYFSVKRQCLPTCWALSACRVLPPAPDGGRAFVCACLCACVRACVRVRIHVHVVVCRFGDLNIHCSCEMCCFCTEFHFWPCRFISMMLVNG